jgi:hypothetical protein
MQKRVLLRGQDNRRTCNSGLGRILPLCVFKSSTIWGRLKREQQRVSKDTRVGRHNIFSCLEE